MKHQVYNKKTKEVIFESDKSDDCLDYYLDNFDGDSEDFDYIIIRAVQNNPLKEE